MRTRTVLFATLVTAVPLLSSPVWSAEPAIAGGGTGDSKTAPAKPSTEREAPTRSVRQLLNRRLPEVKFEAVGLADSIDFIRDVSSLNIHVNWKALEMLNVTKDTAITTKLRNVPVRKALAVILAQASPDNTLAFYNDGGVIEITTRELADADRLTRTYFVGDILMDVPDFVGPTMDLSANNSNSSSGRNGGGGGGSGSSGGIFSKQTDADTDKGKTKTERAEALVSLITQTIRPDIWDINGGQATIKYFNGYLIVTAPRSVHEALGGPVD